MKNRETTQERCYLLKQKEFKVQTLYSPSNESAKKTDPSENWSTQPCAALPAFPGRVRCSTSARGSQQLRADLLFHLLLSLLRDKISVKNESDGQVNT